MDDGAAIDRVLGGDRDAFAVLVDRYRTDAFALARAMLPDRDDAEEAAHDAFVSAFERLSSFDAARGAFRSWLLRIVRNGCINRLRRQRPQSLQHEPTHADGPDVRAEADEAFRALDAALAALPLHQRTAFVLAELEALPHAEIAVIEGVAIGTVKSRVARARASLRQALETRLGGTR